MSVAVVIARILLGLVFFGFGLFGFVPVHPPPFPPGIAGEFASVFFRSHWVLFVDGFECIAGALLLVNRYVPLGLVVLAPIIVNILIFHLTMAPSGILPGLVVGGLWFVVAFSVRPSLEPLLVQRASSRG